MFTGITTHLGKIIRISDKTNPEFSIKSNMELSDVKIGSSIMCSGICLTVIKKNKSVFVINISEETAKVTNAKNWKVGSFVNLEKSLRFGDELSGHLVTGHVDSTTVLKKLIKLEKSHLLYFDLPKTLRKFICKKGSVTLDGISLTVNEVKNNFFTVNIIPHTLRKTTLGLVKKGDISNLEIDILARYIDQNIKNRI